MYLNARVPSCPAELADRSEQSLDPIGCLRHASQSITFQA
jgi:hypothetical protein